MEHTGEHSMDYKMSETFPADIVKLVARSDPLPPRAVSKLSAIGAALVHVPKAGRKASFIRLVERYSNNLVHCPWCDAFHLPELVMEKNLVPRPKCEAYAFQEMPTSAHPLAIYLLLVRQRRGHLPQNPYQALAKSDALVIRDGIISEREGSVALSAAGTEMVVACTTTYRSASVWHKAELTLELCAHHKVYIHFRSLEETEGFCLETGVCRSVDGAHVSVPLGCIEGCEKCNRDFSVDVQKGALHGEAPKVTIKIWHFLALSHDATPWDVFGAMQTPPISWGGEPAVRPSTGVGSVERMYECLKIHAEIANRR
jgi:hypothetical protein